MLKVSHTVQSIKQIVDNNIQILLKELTAADKAIGYNLGSILGIVTKTCDVMNTVCATNNTLFN